jgi:hypothetical protein
MIKQATFSGISLLLLGASLSMAQVVATIDTRGEQPTSPAFHIVGGTGGNGATVSQSLQTSFSVLDPGRLAMGESFDYEFIVTNKSDKTVLMPQSLRWSDVQDTGEQEQRYEQVEVSFALIMDEGDQASIQGNLTLYGKKADPTTMVLLAPGDAVRIVGTTKLTPVWIHPPSASSKIRMQAYLAVNSVRLRPTGSQPDHYRQDERHLY